MDIPEPGHKPDHKAGRKPTHKAATSVVASVVASAVARTLEPKGKVVASHTSVVAVEAFASTSTIADASTKPELVLTACRLHLPR